ncbi:NfeD family protein [Pseudonocardia acidicola]|uniref:NfeD family protein n=1 Tax=Pseudonocardia acidicola TaxID=2724939 RepID=A0ABX1SFJ5_9PSEU|nr:NfeD family protein [Pseudonocardia acidicola]NMI00317.1 NfeD family protein [Pseudonocardia acidicola]
MAAVIWLIAGIVLVVAEVISGDFVLLMLGGGAVLAAAATALGVGPLAGALIFGGTSVLLLFAVRPTLKRRLNRAVPHTVMHSDALVGKRAVVISRVDGDGGRVKIGGDVWSARAYDHTQTMEPGQRVTVMDISGATALVLPEI